MNVSRSVTIPKKTKKTLQRKKNLSLSLLALPGLAWFIIFCYMPMGGAVIAFQNYKPKRGIFGSDWVGLDNFKYLFSSNDAARILGNTLLYNFVSIFLVAAVAVMIALLMDAVKKRIFVKTYQTLLFLPRFISWVVVGYMATALFDYDLGLLNKIREAFGQEAISWYLSPQYWRVILLTANVWKVMGYTSLIYYGSILGINPELYESAEMDGANAFKRVWHITLPLIRPTIIMMMLMSVGSIMKADFGLFYYVPNNSGALYEVTDVIDTYVYRALRGLGDFSNSAATSLFQSVVGFVLVVFSNWVVRKVDEQSSLF